jgi:hypothetical protein
LFTADNLFLDFTVDDKYERISEEEIVGKMASGVFLTGSLFELAQQAGIDLQQRPGDAMGACVYISTTSKTSKTEMSVLAVHPVLQGIGISLTVLNTAFSFARSQVTACSMHALKV